MEIILFIGVAIIFFMVLSIRNHLFSSKSLIAKEFSDLKKQLSELRLHIEINGIYGEDVATERRKQQEAEALQQHLDRITEIERRKQLLHKSTPPISPEPVIKIGITGPAQTNLAEKAGNGSRPAKEGWLESWVKNNPDLEKFIGENLFNKIGIAILVLGIGFFVKYAIDQDWINEYGRVAIGIFCGIVLVGTAHYLRRAYHSFSSVLAGGGLAVFYFTIAFAFHQYHIINQVTAFMIMVVITIFAVLLAFLYDKLELAVIATVGGFITPFLLSTGEGNYVVLFSYLSLLNFGLLTLSYLKQWRLLNTLAFFFTIIIYGSWLVKTFILTPAFPP